MKDRVIGVVLGVMLTAFVAAARADEPRVRPDDERLVDVVRLIESGMSGPLIAEHLRQSEEVYELSVNDLLFLKQSGAEESTIAALMATDLEDAPAAAPAVAPSRVIFDDLVLVKSGFLNGARKGRLVLDGDVLAWEGRGHHKEDFEFQTSGLEKVWFTCEARSSESFCYQINFKIVKGDRYRFRDQNRDSGSNVAITEVMEGLRTYLPRLDFAAPKTAD